MRRKPAARHVKPYSDIPHASGDSVEGDDPRRKQRVIWVTGLLLSVCWVLEVGGRYAVQFDYISGATRDITGLLAMSILGLSFLLVFSNIRRLPPLVHWALLFAILFLVMFQLSDIADEFDAVKDVPLLGKQHAVHQFIENALVGTGGLLLVAGLYYAMLELEWGRRRLEAERRQLAENVAVRERVEEELKAARDRLEGEVESRTKELAQRNEELRVELGDHARAEASLARRLRFEEGLAACSQTLQAESVGAEGLAHALELLRISAGASRVMFFENEQSDGGALAARRVAEAYDPEAARPASVKETSRLSYTGAAAAWRVALAAGHAVTVREDTVAAEEQALVTRLGARSLLMLPVGWEGDWRGVLAFANGPRRDKWEAEVVRMLRTAAELLGAFKERQRAEDSLRKAHEDLERRVAERTADLTLVNKRLEAEIADRRRAERDKEKLEAQLRQAEKMKAIGTLAGGIAHDFNNILSSILGFTEMTMVKADADFPYRRYLEEVFKAGNRAKELVRQILVFSRQSEEERAPINMHDIVDEALALFSPALPENIVLRHALDPDCGTVLADPVQMHQVVMNLLSNAEHAMRENGGVLEVRLEAVRFDAPVTMPQGILLPGAYILLTVSDTGHGIPPEAISRIYEPFYTTKAVGEGTGMGLAIVHGIVTSLGGVVTVESDYRRGAVFRIYLPRSHHAALRRAEPADEDLGGSEHILVVDDEAQLVSMWTEMLRGLGYQVTSHTGSRSALQDFLDDPDAYDLALLDQTMPELSGAELARRMLGKRPGFPIILATGFSEAITAEDARAMGIREFVLKPIIAKDLALTIRRALGDDRATSRRNLEDDPS